jgi:hypothetical protein
VKEGKTVLFVSEKMAALEVVKGRLEGLGLGGMCLELHSNKANKKAVLEEPHFPRIEAGQATSLTTTVSR